MADSLACLGGLLLLAGFGSATFLVAWWIFRPLDVAGKRLDRPTQFTIVDFFCLFFLIQFPMAFIHFGDSRPDWREEGMTWVLDGFVWFACGSLWVASVRTLSRAGVTNPWHRAVHLAFVLPVAIAGAIAVPVLSTVSVVSLLGILVGSAPPELWALLSAIDLALIAAVYAAGRWTRRMLRAALGDLPTRTVGAAEVPEDGKPGEDENRH
jgi:hypothetical protein